MIRMLCITLLILSCLSISCEEASEEMRSGTITISFVHVVGNEPVLFDQMIYTNAAGNNYEISEVQWFISDITLVGEDGKKHLLDSDHYAHYVDTNLPATCTWSLPDSVTPGNYAGILMTFGLKGEKNLPYSFANAPESDMMWPYTLGGDYGGYHYMKLNGFWINREGQRTPFNAHLGVGQTYDDNGIITGFVQNWFEVMLPGSSFAMKADETKSIRIVMDIQSWFETPAVFDFNEQGAHIMKNQSAMDLLTQNGRDVFTCSFESTNDW